jgi:hypothetical protein
MRTPARSAPGERGDTSAPAPETAVRANETVAATCPYCDRPFASSSARDLHVGEVHDGPCDPDEQEAYERARAAERDDLFYYHLRVVVALGVLYAVTVLVYMIALGSDLL